MPGDIHKGYLRYRVSKNGLALEHYMVARIAWGPRMAWPRGYTVHHMDWKRAHNCRANLVIMPEAMNNLIRTNGRRRD